MKLVRVLVVVMASGTPTLLADEPPFLLALGDKREGYSAGQVDFGPDGTLSAVFRGKGPDGKTQNEFRQWKVPAGQLVSVKKLPHDFMRFGPTGKTMLLCPWEDYAQPEKWGQKPPVQLRDVASGKTITLPLRDSAGSFSLAFSPSGDTLALAMQENPTGEEPPAEKAKQDNAVLLLEVGTTKCLATLRGHTKSVSAIALSPDGKLVAAGSDDETVVVWDVATRKEVALFQEHTAEVSCVSFSPDGKRVASSAADKDGLVKVWDAATGRELATMREPSKPVRGLVWSPYGKLLTGTCEDATVPLWDPSTGRLLTTLRRHSGGFTSNAFSPDGKLFASGGDDGTIKLWDMSHFPSK